MCLHPPLRGGVLHFQRLFSSTRFPPPYFQFYFCECVSLWSLFFCTLKIVFQKLDSEHCLNRSYTKTNGSSRSFTSPPPPFFFARNPLKKILPFFLPPTKQNQKQDNTFMYLLFITQTVSTKGCNTYNLPTVQQPSKIKKKTKRQRWKAKDPSCS